MKEHLVTPTEHGLADPQKDKIHQITDWLRSEVTSARPELLQETLDRIGALFEVGRVLMVWEEPDEPWVNLACTQNQEGLVWKQAAPSSFVPIVADRLRGLPFWYAGPAKSRDAVINQTLVDDFEIGRTMSLPLDSEDLQGRIFVLDLETVEPGHFLIGQIVSAVVESRFGQAARSDQREGFEADEKVRMIARDLHDGLLQSFTGIVLQLENLIPLIETDPEKAHQSITEIEALLMNEQRELRSYLQSLREKRKSKEIDFDMTGRLRDLAHRYQDQWGVAIEYRRETLDPLVRRALGWETYRIITEAITNATRHGHAKHVRVTLATEGDQLRISVQDDGEGFPFRGTFTGQELIDREIEPGSLTERILALNGEISIESTDQGSRLDISIPIGWTQS